MGKAININKCQRCPFKDRINVLKEQDCVFIIDSDYVCNLPDDGCLNKIKGSI